jgi:hypothetical protein
MTPKKKKNHAQIEKFFESASSPFALRGWWKINPDAFNWHQQHQNHKTKIFNEI